jgi:hypothetical protein
MYFDKKKQFKKQSQPHFQTSKSILRILLGYNKILKRKLNSQ